MGAGSLMRPPIPDDGKSTFDHFHDQEASGKYQAMEGGSHSGQGAENNSSIDGEIRSGSWMSARIQASRSASPASCLKSLDTLTRIHIADGTSRSTGSDS